MKPRHRSFIAAASLGLMQLHATTAGAQPASSPPARTTAKPAAAKPEPAELKRVGDDAMATFKFAEALAAYEQAYELEPLPALLFNRGRALQLLDRLPEALEAFERFKRDAPPDLLAKVPKLEQLIGDVRAQVGTIEVVTKVVGAEVVIGGRTVGMTPLALPVRLKRDKAVVVEVRKEGYHTLERRLDLSKVSSVRLEVEPKRKDTTALLLVASPVAGARVFVDDRPIGNAPSESFLLPGSHRVQVSAPGYDDSEITVVLEVGERKPVTVLLKEETPVYKRWWLWTAVGAVVVTGVVLGVAYTTGGAASTGDIAPGQISAPLLTF